MDETSGYEKGIDDCDIEWDRNEKGLQVRLIGLIDTNNSNRVKKVLFALLDETELGKEYVLELSRLNYISSTGVGLLSYLLIESQKKQIRLILENINPRVRDLLSTLGFLSFFEGR